jgi:hypothetical protein
MAVNNARVLHGKAHGKGGAPLPSKSFFMRLKEEMLAKARAWKPEPKKAKEAEKKEPEKEKRRHKLEWWSKQPATLRLDCLRTPKVVNKVQVPTAGNKPKYQDPRGNCIVCSMSRKNPKKRGEAASGAVAKESEVAKAQRLAAVRKGGAVDSLLMGAFQDSTRTKTGEMCKQCDVFLCFSRDNATTCCFDLWHNTNDLATLRA